MAKRTKPKKQLPQQLDAQQALTTAQNAFNAGDYKLATALMLKFVQAAPHFGPGHLALGIAFNKLHRWPEAKSTLTKALELIEEDAKSEAPNPQIEMGRKFNTFMARIELARCLTTLGELDEASAVLDLAVPVTEKSNTLVAHKLRVQLARGESKQAADAVKPLLANADTDVEVALLASEIALADANALPPADIAEHLIATSKRVGLPAGILITLLHAVGKTCNACERYDDAFDAWRRAASLPKTEFRQRAFMAEVVSSLRGWQADTYSKVVRADTQDQTPVLLVGMPGRGLNSIASLINAHPEAENIGATEFLSETARYQFNAPANGNYGALHRPGVIRGNDTREAGARYTKALRKRAANPGAKRIVDANGVNTIQLGLLGVINPNARIVFVSDDPFTSCLDSWSSNSAYAHPFVSTAVSLALYWRGETNLAAHWEKTFTADSVRQPWHRVNLADFRKAPEETARALFMFLGLDWNDDLKHHALDAAATPVPNPENYRHRLKSLANAIERASISTENLKEENATPTASSSSS